MISLPPLLPNKRNEQIPEQTFLDLQCKKLFSESTYALLRIPCDPENLQKRRETFLRLDQPRCDRLREILPILSAIKHHAQLLPKTEDPCERLFLRCSLLEEFSAATNLLCDYGHFGPCFRDVETALTEDENLSLRNKIQESTKKARTLLNGISCFDVGCGITFPSEAESCNHVLRRYAKQIDCDTAEQKEQKIPLKTLAPEYLQVFAETLSQVEAILSPFDNFNPVFLLDFEDEIRFFLEIFELCREAAKKGIPTCLPVPSETVAFTAAELYDITLLRSEPHIVANDTYFTESEPFFLLTGANGGGKTTYLRAVGCNLILALAGCPVFARTATVYPFTSVLTHFPEDERFTSGGRMENEQKRANALLQTKGTPFLLFNEPYSSTDEQHGFAELEKTCNILKQQNRAGLCVTHFHQCCTVPLPRLSTVVEDGNHKRTFRICRDSEASASFAANILQKYGLDAESLRERRVHREN